MDQNMQKFKEFMQIYNKLSETCFKTCVESLSSPELESQEVKCVEDCAAKLIKINQRFMSIYVDCQQILVNKRIKEAEEQSKQSEELSRKAEAARLKEAEEQVSHAATNDTNVDATQNDLLLQNKEVVVS